MRLFRPTWSAASSRATPGQIPRLASFALILFATLLTSGCVTYEGVSMGQQAIGSKVLARHGAQPPSTSELPAEEEPEYKPVSGLIVVGNVSAYRKFSERSSKRAYGSYVAFQETWRKNPSPALAADNFSQAFSGWTNLKVTGVPGLYACYERILVPAPLAADILFADPVGTFLFQISEDLVAARTNAEGVFVAAERLCGRTEPGYRQCAARYLRGYFDAETGLMLDGKLRPARSGKRIDGTTFVRVDETVAGASAAE